MCQDKDTSNAVVRPPVACILALVAGVAADRFYPLRFVPASVPGAWVLGGHAEGLAPLETKELTKSESTTVRWTRAFWPPERQCSTAHGSAREQRCASTVSCIFVPTCLRARCARTETICLDQRPVVCFEIEMPGAIGYRARAMHTAERTGARPQRSLVRSLRKSQSNVDVIAMAAAQ
jgi:hypothetical protein